MVLIEPMDGGKFVKGDGQPIQTLMQFLVVDMIRDRYKIPLHHDNPTWSSSASSAVWPVGQFEVAALFPTFC